MPTNIADMIIPLRLKERKRRKAMTADVARLKSLLQKAKNELTKDEVIDLFNLTRKRIQEIEQKAINRLNKNKPDQEDTSIKEQ